MTCHPHRRCSGQLRLTQVFEIVVIIKQVAYYPNLTLNALGNLSSLASGGPDIYDEVHRGRLAGRQSAEIGVSQRSSSVKISRALFSVSQSMCSS